MNPTTTPAAVDERTEKALVVKLEFSAAACVVRTSPITLIRKPMASDSISLMLNESLLRTTTPPWFPR